MSNYSRSTNFTSKDALPSGNAAKIIKGSEFDTEFNAIATAMATKQDVVSGVSSTEIGYLDGVTSSIQNQIWDLWAAIPGNSQTWQDVKASRAINTTYTNSTSKPIVVSASVAGTVASSTISVSFEVGGVAGINENSVIAGAAPSNTTLSATCLVPPGATYKLNVTQGSLSKWVELRS